jgi:hypothetical protein
VADLPVLPARVLRHAVDAAVRDGDTLDEIERDIIDESALSPEGRSALWLYAWGAVERRQSGRTSAVVNVRTRVNVR